MSRWTTVAGVVGGGGVGSRGATGGVWTLALLCSARFFAISVYTPDMNGIKLACELLLYQLLTQFLPGLDHKGEALGPPFLDARLDSMRSDGDDDQHS